MTAQLLPGSGKPVSLPDPRNQQGILSSPWFNAGLSAPATAAIPQALSPTPAYVQDAMENWGMPPLRPEAPTPERTPQTHPPTQVPFPRLANGDYADNVPRSLIQSESSGNWFAQNDAVGSSGRAGHYGQLQFGHDRLDDARKAGIIPQNMTADQFKANKSAQINVGNWHFADIDKRIRSNGLSNVYGQRVGGEMMTPNAMRAIAHLGGFGGLKEFVRTNGTYNPADEGGTTLASYARRHR